LKRQARKAELVQRVPGHGFGRSETRLAIHRHNDGLTADIRKAQDLLKELKDTDLQHSARLQKLDAAVEEIKLKRWQKNQEITAQKSLKFDTQRKIDRLESDLDHGGREVKRLGEEVGRTGKGPGRGIEKNRHIAGGNRSDRVKVRTHRIRSPRRCGPDRRRGGRLTGQPRKALAGLERDLEENKANLMELVAQEARHKNVYQNTVSNKDSLVRRLKRIDEEVAMAARKVDEIARCRQEALDEQASPQPGKRGDRGRDRRHPCNRLTEKNAACAKRYGRSRRRAGKKRPAPSLPP
jgi:chromosome segregation protein